MTKNTGVFHLLIEQEKKNQIWHEHKPITPISRPFCLVFFFCFVSIFISNKLT